MNNPVKQLVAQTAPSYLILKVVLLFAGPKGATPIEAAAGPTGAPLSAPLLEPQKFKTALYPVMRVHRTGLESVIFGRSDGQKSLGMATEEGDDEEEDGF